MRGGIGTRRADPLAKEHARDETSCAQLRPLSEATAAPPLAGPGPHMTGAAELALPRRWKISEPDSVLSFRANQQAGCTGRPKCRIFVVQQLLQAP